MNIVQTATAPLCNEKMNVFLSWFAELMDEHGPGVYEVTVRKDGSVTVKRPRKPLEFEWKSHAQ